MMDNSGIDVSPDEVRRAVRQAILLNEYLLRRAWGVLYIVMALSMFLSSFGSPILESLGVVNFLGALVMNFTASGCGLIVILWAFKRVRNTAEVTHANDQAWARLLGYKFLVPLWLAINAVLISTIILERDLVSLEFFLFHFGLAIYLYYALNLSFSLKLPPEAVVSIGSILLSSVASLALLSIVKTPGIYALLAVATIVAWIFSGVYASTRAIPEFEEEHTGLE
ncbi:MAG TPA: hypothetical protein VJN71_09950 [Nitrososphaerales archaeon]|nr:hypothetical protein [Nitrososphaerales archaeon]